MERQVFLRKALLGLSALATGPALAEKLASEALPSLFTLKNKENNTMKTILHTAQTRGHANHGWLDAHHSFSFANYYDPARIHFGALRVLNDDTVAGGKGFGRHPHDNMEIVTIPLEGDLEHKDSMGNTEVIRHHDIQLMSAGKGVYHSEYNHNKDKKVNLLQIWVFPEVKDITPRYEQKTYLPEDRKNRLQVVVAPGTEGALTINQKAWFSMGNLDKGTVIPYDVKRKGNGVYVFVIEGDITVGGQPLHKRDALGIWETDAFEIKVDSDAQVLLIDVPMEF